MREISRRSFIVGVAAAAQFGSAARAQHAASTGPRVALKGYDPVSYFTDGKPDQGSKEFSVAFDDSSYWFKSAAHRDMFAANPEKYAPQFDGYCAMQLSRGIKAEADPEVWTIENGKLYVFSKKPAIPKFAQDPADIAAKAGENWKRLRAAKN